MKKHHLEYLKPKHIKWLVSPEDNLGILAMFEHKLAAWQNSLKKDTFIENKSTKEGKNKVDLLSLIKHDKNLITKFEKEKLSDGDVKRLLSYIVAHFVENDKKLTNNDMEELSVQIEISFPGESKVRICILIFFVLINQSFHITLNCFSGLTFEKTPEETQLGNFIINGTIVFERSWKQI